MKKTFLAAIIVFVIVALTGCGGGGGGAPAPGTLRLQNSSTVYIDSFNLTPSSSPAWGPEQLPGSLPPGSSFDIAGISPGLYDARARYFATESTYYAYYYSISIAAGSLNDLIVLDSDFTGSVEIVNGTAGANIIGVYIVPAGSTSLGPNQITSSILPGGSAQFPDLDAGLYDITVVWNSGPDSVYLSERVSSLVLLTITAT